MSVWHTCVYVVCVCLYRVHMCGMCVYMTRWCVCGVCEVCALFIIHVLLAGPTTSSPKWNVIST